MVPRVAHSPVGKNQSEEKLAFIQQMLAELTAVARAEGAELLSYLLDMAYEEARDLRERR